MFFKSKVLLLTAAISILTVLSLPIYMQLVVWPSYDQFIMGTTERGLEFLASRMIQDSRLKTPLERETGAPDFLIEEAERIRATVGLTKVKIFTREGEIVYSSDRADIGKLTSKSFFPQMLLDGKSRSELAFKTLPHPDGSKRPQQIIETYVPIITEGRALGAFEIYFDVTDINTALHALMGSQLAVLVPAALLLLAAALASTYVASRTLRDLIKAKERFQELAVSDSLTGLLNYRGFKTEVKRQLKVIDRGERYAFLIFVDLNDFKQINDALGHEVGDSALMKVADILRDTFRASDTIGRLGGDEFAILASQDVSADDQQAIARRLEAGIAKWNASHPEVGYTISMSYGIVAYSPKEPCSLKELLRQADALMYQNKQQRKRERSMAAAQAAAPAADSARPDPSAAG